MLVVRKHMTFLWLLEFQQEWCNTMEGLQQLETLRQSVSNPNFGAQNQALVFISHTDFQALGSKLHSRLGCVY